MGTHSAVLLRALLGVTVIMVQTVLRLAFLATAAFAAPAADADADPFYGVAPYAVAPIVHHVVPVCKVVPKTVVVGKQCHAEPECTTAPVVVGKKITGHETQSVRRSRFPLSLTDTTVLSATSARERLMPSL